MYHNWYFFFFFLSEDPLLRLDSLSKPIFLSVSRSIRWPTLQSLRSSESRQSGRARYGRLLLKIGWWLTLERLLHTYNFMYELCSNNFYAVFWGGGIWFEKHNVVCFPKTLDICRTSVRPGMDAQAWVTHTHKLSHTSSLSFTAIVTGLNISFDPHSSSPRVLPFNNLSTYSHRTNSIRTESDRKWE